MSAQQQSPSDYLCTSSTTQQVILLAPPMMPVIDMWAWVKDQEYKTRVFRELTAHIQTADQRKSYHPDS